MCSFEHTTKHHREQGAFNCQPVQYSGICSIATSDPGNLFMRLSWLRGCSWGAAACSFHQIASCEGASQYDATGRDRPAWGLHPHQSRYCSPDRGRRKAEAGFQKLQGCPEERRNGKLMATMTPTKSEVNVPQAASGSGAGMLRRPGCSSRLRRRGGRRSRTDAGKKRPKCVKAAAAVQKCREFAEDLSGACIV